MASLSTNNQSGDHPVPVYVVPCEGVGKEITLADLLRVLARRKWWIILGVIAALAISLLYLVFAQKMYRAEVRLLPPTLQDIQGLVDEREVSDILGIDVFTTEFVYAEFMKNLKSNRLRGEFLDSLVLQNRKDSSGKDTGIIPDRLLDDYFKTGLSIKEARKDDSGTVVKLLYPDPQTAADLLNKYVGYIDERTGSQLKEYLSHVLIAKTEYIRDTLAIKLKLAEQMRNDKILQLKEALRIAEARIIDDKARGVLDTNPEKHQSKYINSDEDYLDEAEINALRTEIIVLESRTSDESFIPEYRKLQEQLYQLNNATISPDPRALSTVMVDLKAVVPTRVESPKRKELLFVAFLAGLIAGIFAAFSAEFLSNMRNEL